VNYVHKSLMESGILTDALVSPVCNICGTFLIPNAAIYISFLSAVHIARICCQRQRFDDIKLDMVMYPHLEISVPHTPTPGHHRSRLLSTMAVPHA